MAKWFLGFNGPVLLAGLFVAGCESPAPQVPPDSYRPPTPAEQACVNQGFVRGSDGYDQCMGRENAAGKPPPPPAVTPPEGVFAFKDEYGFRYDALGNRLDAQGKVISPHTP